MLEHGVNLDLFLKEMGRIIKPNGFLIISIDYWEDKIALNGTDIIFSKEEAQEMIKKSENFDFKLLQDIDYKCKDKVYENIDGVRFSFVLFYLKKVK